MDTMEFFEKTITDCEEILLEKAQKYGTSWTAYRTGSFIDKLWIKAKRVRIIQETGENQVNEPIETELQALINYSVLCILQIRNNFPIDHRIDAAMLSEIYRGVISEVGDLLMRKNHDYGEAWRDMSIETITDEILVKLLRCRQIATSASARIEEELFDIINYSVFALVLLNSPSETDL